MKDVRSVGQSIKHTLKLLVVNGTIGSAPAEKGKTMDENYISLERAIERMYEVTEECGTDRIFIDRIIDELENLPSSPNICIHPRWTPVSERLPEDNTAVIVATDNGMVFQCLYAYDGWDLWDGYKVNITHWMPLPEPPKEDI